MATTAGDATGINLSNSGDLTAHDSGAVLVYFPVNVGVDVSGNVEIFGEDITTSNRLVISSSTSLTAAHLKAYVQYQEDPDNRDEVRVTTTANTDVKSDLDTLVEQPVTLDSGYADWWNDGGNKNVANRTNYLGFNSLAEFLLAQIAYDVLGHPMAKAGIANDSTIIAGFTDPSQGIGKQIVTAIDDAAAEDGNKKPGTGALKMVYRQLFKLAPSRFQVQDSTQGNSNTTNDTLPKDMPFVAGDKIRFELTLNSYSVITFTAAASADTTGTAVTKNTNGGLTSTNYGANTYTLEIQLA